MEEIVIFNNVNPFSSIRNIRETNMVKIIMQLIMNKST